MNDQSDGGTGEELNMMQPSSGTTGFINRGHSKNESAESLSQIQEASERELKPAQQNTLEVEPELEAKRNFELPKDRPNFIISTPKEAEAEK